MCVCVTFLDDIHDSNQMSKTISTKFCSQVLRRKVSDEFVNGQKFQIGGRLKFLKNSITNLKKKQPDQTKAGNKLLNKDISIHLPYNNKMPAYQRAVMYF